MAEKRTDVQPREGGRLARREPTASLSPFGMFERFADEIDRVFDDFGFERHWLRPRGWLRAPSRGFGAEIWRPQVDVFQRKNELVVRADLPGLKREDVSVEVTEDGLTISGERREEREEEREGVYRSERSYGSFHRVVPLPEGAMADQAKATFKDGVLEVTMPAPPEQVTRGRRLEITESAEAKK